MPHIQRHYPVHAHMHVHPAYHQQRMFHQQPIHHAHQGHVPTNLHIHPKPAPVFRPVPVFKPIPVFRHVPVFRSGHINGSTDFSASAIRDTILYGIAGACIFGIAGVAIGTAAAGSFFASLGFIGGAIVSAASIPTNSDNIQHVNGGRSKVNHHASSQSYAQTILQEKNRAISSHHYR